MRDDIMTNSFSDFMTAHNLTTDDLAFICNVSSSRAALWQKGSLIPSQNEIALIAIATGSTERSIAKCFRRFYA